LFRDRQDSTAHFIPRFLPAASDETPLVLSCLCSSYDGTAQAAYQAKWCEIGGVFDHLPPAVTALVSLSF
jgi:hypothetical protein